MIKKTTLMNRKDKVAMSIMGYGISDMTQKRRGEISDWLECLADDICSKPDSFSKKFRIRFLYCEGKK